MTHELKCAKCNEETAAGPDEKAVKETMARHMAKAHPAKAAKK